MRRIALAFLVTLSFGLAYAEDPVQLDPVEVCKNLSLPIYPGATFNVEHSVSLDGTYGTFFWTSNDSIAKIIAYYEKALKVKRNLLTSTIGSIELKKTATRPAISITVMANSLGGTDKILISIDAPTPPDPNFKGKGGA